MPEVETIFDEDRRVDDLLLLKEDYFTLKAEAESFADDLKIKRASLDEMIAALRGGWEAENAELLRNAKESEAEFERKDKELRAAVVAAWPGGNAPKTVADGLSVRVNTKLVYDEGAAIRWAIEKNLPDLLKLDATKFKKAAEALKPAFVVEESSITAVIKE